jgi:hypothetical protein
MRSRLFSKSDPTRNEDFGKDLELLSKQRTEVLAALPTVALHSMSRTTASEKEEILEQFSQEVGIPASVLEHCMDITQLFLRQFAHGGSAAEDSPKDLALDLSELYDFVEESKDRLESFFEQVKMTAAEKGTRLIRGKNMARAMLPNLSTINTAIDLRAVFAEAYTSETDVDDYVPECLGVVPVAIVRIGLSRGQVEEVAMQLTEGTLSVLVKHLLSTQKQLEATKKQLNVGMFAEDE